jgi:hypothetical protein
MMAFGRIGADGVGGPGRHRIWRRGYRDEGRQFEELAARQQHRRIIDQ